MSKKFEIFPDTEILSLAQDFAKAGALLNVAMAPAVPQVINKIFALELYIKSLHAEQEYSNDDRMLIKRRSLLLSRSHSLVEIFKQLPPGKAAWLQKRYEKYSHAGGTDTLSADLAKFDNVFVDWRYLYEGKGKSIELTLLNALIDFFDLACQPSSILEFLGGKRQEIDD